MTTNPFSQHAGGWRGTNSFRLMPSDPLHAAAATASVSTGATDTMAVMSYTWSHPGDGEQDGLLALGCGDAPDEIVALWGDSWHQSPTSRIVVGSVSDGVITVGYAYGDGDWWWHIIIDLRDTAVLRVRMDNTVPASAASPEVAAGAYSAMIAELRRAD